MSNDKKWRTAGGIVVIERGMADFWNARARRFEPKIAAQKLTGGFHGWCWLHNLTPVRARRILREGGR